MLLAHLLLPSLGDAQQCLFAAAWYLQVYLISTKAGSVGINLTAAFRMIIYDELWNPVHNAQVSFVSINAATLLTSHPCALPLPAFLCLQSQVPLLVAQDTSSWSSDRVTLPSDITH